jgi:hypothetical protein
LLPSAVANRSLTLAENLLVWNVRGLNNKGHRNILRELVTSECVPLVCIQETKTSEQCACYLRIWFRLCVSAYFGCAHGHSYCLAE